MKLKTTSVAAVLGALVAAAPAAAHVTVQPSSVPAGGFTRVDVRVPNERDDAGTVKVAVQFPDGIASASYEPVAGWAVDVQTERAPAPIELHGEEVTEQVKQITWTGEGADGVIPPGAFQDFGLSVPTPDSPGETLTFPALQAYEGGEVVRWIGEPDSDEPAPTVTLTAPAEEHAAPDAEEESAEAEDEAADPAEEASATEDEDGGSDGLAIAGLVVGGLGLLTGGAALSRTRRS